MQRVSDIAKYFSKDATPVNLSAITTGHVNNTFLVELDNGESFVLQMLSKEAFASPERLMFNAVTALNHIAGNTAAKQPFEFLTTNEDKYLLQDSDGGYWRASRYIANAHTATPASSVEEIAEFGRVLGDFHASLAYLPAEKLYFTIPNFHNTPKRYEAFSFAKTLATPESLEKLKGEISFIESRRNSCSLLLDMKLPARVIHNDAKLDNVMYSNETGKALCLIDYDTIMPGVFAFDFGDAVRSSCFNCEDSERDMTKVKFDAERYTAFTTAYLARAKRILKPEELKSLVMGVRMISLELGMRFLTDYLEGNHYFNIEYPDQNIVRARVQLLICAQVEKNYNNMCSILVNAAKGSK